MGGDEDIGAVRSNNNLIVLDKSQAKVHASPPPPEMQPCQCFFFFFFFLLFQDVHIDRFSSYSPGLAFNQIVGPKEMF